VKKKSNEKKFHQQRFDPDNEHSVVTKIMSLQRRNDIIAMLLEGKESKEIRHYISSKYKVTPGSANIFISQARKEIKKRKNFEIGNLISMHIHRYEKIYKELFSLRAQIAAIDALRAKEKLMGFHKEGFHMKVTNSEIQSVHLQTVDSEYDLGELNSKQSKRLNQLLSKATNPFRPRKKVKDDEQGED
jgi:hypothetical protein